MARLIRGSRQPRFLSMPAGVKPKPGDFADRASQLAELAGFGLDPWQDDWLRRALRRDKDGLSVSFESCLLVPRQNGKSVALEAFDLAKLYLMPAPHLILHTAHLFPTAMESFRHLESLIVNCPELHGEVAKISHSHGEEGFELKSGSRLRFAARTVSGAGRGFSPETVIMDEAMRLPLEATSALIPALSAKRDPQLVYASSAGYPDSEVLIDLVSRGRMLDEDGNDLPKDDDLFYSEWSLDPELGLDPLSPEAFAMSNPALGFRQTMRKLLKERKSMTAEDHGRERHGQWAERRAKGVIDMNVWNALEDLTSSTDQPAAFGVEISMDRDAAAVGVAGPSEGGRWHVELLESRRGVSWLLGRCRELGAAHPYVPFVVDGAGPAAELIPRLEDEGYVVITAGTKDVALAFSTVLDRVKDKTLRHGPQAELAQAVKIAKKRPMGDGLYAFGRVKSGENISPVQSVALALWVATTQPAVDLLASVY